MISDNIRTLAYRDAIRENEARISGRRVIDVGSGTGILSLFAAECGAAHVDSIEASSIASIAREIVSANGYGGVIEVHEKLVEDACEMIKEKEDILISEWMGYCLLFEGMLESVITARDKLLADGGLMFPCACKMYLYGIEDPEGREGTIDFWNDVYNFDMSMMKELAYRECYVDILKPENVCTTEATVLDLDLYKVTKDDLMYIENAFCLSAKKNTSIDGFGMYFDCSFPSTNDDKQSWNLNFPTKVLLYMSKPYCELHIANNFFIGHQYQEVTRNSRE